MGALIACREVSHMLAHSGIMRLAIIVSQQLRCGFLCSYARSRAIRYSKASIEEL